MAAKVKGLTLEIDGNTVGLEKGLAKLNKPINAIKNELKDVTRLLKLDPGNTELLAQKQQLLSKQIAESKDKLVALQQAKQQADADMKSGTEVNQEEYRKPYAIIMTPMLLWEMATRPSSTLSKRAKVSPCIAEKRR